MPFRVLLTPFPNSHPFFERECPLDHPLKIGRSVAKFKSCQENLIFDCKVLSRNHALLWEDGGKFYLKDTKSSNGTFVNKERLSRSGEESNPVEIKAGDELQFGVDVIENKKVTHSSIVGRVTFISLDDPSSTATIAKLETVSSRDLIELSQLLKTMKEREQSLATKLANIQDLVTTMEGQTEHGFQMLLTEDQLLSRIEVLENQLQLYCESYSGDDLRHQISELLDQKMQYELKSKESLRRVLQEKLEYASRLSEIQRNYDQSEEECEKLRIMYDESQKAAEQLAVALKTKEADMLALHGEMSGMKERLTTLEEQNDEEKARLEKQVEHLTGQENSWTVQIESLQAEVDFGKEQLSAARAKLESLTIPTEKTAASIQASPESQDVSVQTDSLPIAENSTQTIIQTFNDAAIQTELDGAHTEPEIVSTTTSLVESMMPTSLPVTEEVQLKQTALLQSEPECSLASEDSVALQQKLADAEAQALELETQRSSLISRVHDLEVKLSDAEASASSAADVSQILDQVWKQLNEANEQNKRLQATLARQRADVDTARNQLKAEQESLSREKAEGEQMTRRNKILSIQLTELQDQLDRQSSSTSVVPKESEEQITERRQQQRRLLQRHLSTLNQKVKEKDERIEVLHNQLKDVRTRSTPGHVSREMGIILGILAAVMAWFGLYIISWIAQLGV